MRHVVLFFVLVFAAVLAAAAPFSTYPSTSDSDAIPITLQSLIYPTKELVFHTLESRAAKSSSGTGYYGDSLTARQITVGSLLIVSSVYLLTAGYLIYDPTVILNGYLFFTVLIWIGMINTRPSNGFINDYVTGIAVPMCIGVFGILLICLSYRYSKLERVPIYILSINTGVAFAIYICSWSSDLVIKNDIGRSFFLVGCGLLFAGITLWKKIEGHLLLAYISFLGADLLYIGVDILAKTGYMVGVQSVVDHITRANYSYELNAKVYALLALTLVTTGLSAGGQHFLNRKKPYWSMHFIKKASVHPQ